MIASQTYPGDIPEVGRGRDRRWSRGATGRSVAATASGVAATVLDGAGPL